MGAGNYHCLHFFKISPERFDVHYGELDLLQEPAESSGCGEEEEGQGGFLRQVSLKLQEGIFSNADNLPVRWCSPKQTDGG